MFARHIRRFAPTSAAVLLLGGGSLTAGLVWNDSTPISRVEEARDIRVKVLRNKALSPHTRLVRLQLPPHETLDYNFGSFVFVKGINFNVDESFPLGKRIQKPYLPLQPLDQSGHFDLIVKTYPSPAGCASRYIADLKRGDEVEVVGPLHRPGVDLDPKSVKKVGIICGGSGLTAAVQLVRILLNSRDTKEKGDDEEELPSPLHISIIASDKTEEDLFYVKEFEKLCKEHPGKIQVYRTLTRETPLKKTWQGGIGRVSKELLVQHMPKDADLIVVVGPDEFVKHVAGDAIPPNNVNVESNSVQPNGLLKQAGFHNSSVIVL